MASRTVGAWRLERSLGRGGMGEVLRAVHMETGEAAAIKVLNAIAPLMLSGIRREIAALRRIRHPGVVAIVDDGLADGVPFYAMELVEGESLRQRLRTGVAALSTEVVESDAPSSSGEPAAQLDTFAIDRDGPHALEPARGTRLAVPEALEIVGKLCRALAYVHGEGIVHRDLKPENVMVRPDGELVIVDFGLMKDVAVQGGREALDVGAAVVGTPSYIAPEQASGDSVDARADIYALGCILYELLTGSPPFVGTNAEVLWKHKQAPIPPPSTAAPRIPPEVDAFVMALLAKDPRRRMGYATDVEERIRAMGVALPERSGPEPRPYLYRPSLAGRDDTLGSLAALLAEAGGECVLLSGESGVGKTRLLSELGRRALSSGFHVLAGECGPERPPLSALRGVLRSVGDRCRLDGPDAARRILGDAGERLGQLEPSLHGIPGIAELPQAPGSGDEEDGRERIIDDVTRVLAGASRERKTLVILDDVQWADELAAAALVRWIARGVPGDLILVAAFRAEEARFLDEVPLGPRSRRLELGRLDELAVRSIVGDMLASGAAPGELVRHLARETEGNPFFLAEYLHAAAARGVLVREGSSWRWLAGGAGAAGQLRELGMPRSRRELVSRRIDELPETTRAVLAACAVIGRESPVRLVASLAPVPEADLDAAVVELVRRRFLVELPGALRFEHDKLREVAYDLVDPLRRPLLHRAAAEALSRDPTRAPELAATLGLHWERAAEPLLASRAYLEAADLAVGRYALDEAEATYRRAFELTDDVEVRALAAVGLAHGVLSPRDRSGAALDVLHAALAGASGRPAEVRVKVAMIHVLSELGRFAEAEEVARSMVKHFHDQGDFAHEAVALGDLAEVLEEAGRADDAKKSYEQALVAFHAARHPPGDAVAIANLGRLLWKVGDLVGARPLFERALSGHRAAGNRVNEGAVVGNLAILDSYQGDLAGAAERFEEALRIHRRVGSRRSEGNVLSSLANVRRSQGDLAGARRALEEALEIQRETANVRGEVQSLAHLAAVELDSGNVARARQLLHEARAKIRDDPSERGLAYVQYREAAVCLAAGDAQASRELAAAARERYAAAGDQHGEALACCMLGRAELARGGSGAGVLACARAIAAEIGAGPESALAREVETLRAAVAAAGGD